MSLIKKLLNYCWMILLALTLVMLTLSQTAEAAQVNDATVRQTLLALEIIDSSTANNATVSRAGLGRMLVQSSASRNTISGTGSISPFADVSFKHPEAGYIRAASQAGYMTAMADGKFHPDEAATAGVAVKGLLTLLGYSRDQYGVDYWQFAANAGLLDDLSISENVNITQQQANRMFYNALKAPTASGKSQAEILGFATENGGIDMQAVINSTATGPLTVYNANWHKGSGLDVSTATVYRNDGLSSLSALQNYDIVYYNSSMNTVWAYSDKVSGVYKGAAPTRLSPTSINISGMEYTLSEAAAAKLAAGNIELGETLILLLGSDGGAADFLRQSEIVFDVTGFATAAEKIVGKDADGSDYNGYTITLITADGSVLNYEVRRNYSNMVGKLVKLSYNNGDTGVIARQPTSLNGEFSAENMTLGSMRLAADVLILETYSNGAYDVTYPARLDGVRIDQGKIQYYTRNADGAISAMFISNITGDLLDYGIVTSVQESRPGLNDDAATNTDEDSSTSSGSGSTGSTALSGSYGYVIDGKTGTASLSGAALHGEKGPSAFVFRNNQLQSLRPLEEIKKVTLHEAGYVLDRSNTRYLLSDSVSVYRYLNGEYKLLSLKQGRELGVTFSAYYDKPEADGGRIRILIVDEGVNDDK